MGEHEEEDSVSTLVSSEVDASLVSEERALGLEAGALAVVRETQRQRQRQHQQKRSTLVVAGTVDGQVHALDPATGDLKWSFSTGDPLVKSYQQLPGMLDEKRWLIPTLDGSVLVHTAQGLRRPGLKARLLVEQTPFLDQAGTFFTGSKVSHIFGVDALTGEVRQVLSGDTPDSLESNRRLLARSGSDDDVIWIGRNDHTIRAFDVATGQEQWTLTIGEFVSLDDLYLAALSAPAPSLTATEDRWLHSVPAAAAAIGGGGEKGSSPELDWNVQLPAHVASVFRVSLEEGSTHTYLPMQPLPLSQSARAGAPAVGGGSGGTAAVRMLDNGQVYAVALGEHGGSSEGEDGGGGGGSGGGPGGHVGRGKKGRAGEGKVTQGGRTTATQPLLPHGGEWQQQREGGDGSESDGGGALVQSLSARGSSRSCTESKSVV